MQYGIAVKNVSVRTEPTMEPLRKDREDIWDRRQESRLNIGEAVQIKRLGENWFYVISDTTAGYALADGFVICTKAQYENRRTLFQREHRVVLKGGRNDWGKYFRAGTILPPEGATFESETYEKGRRVNRRETWGAMGGWSIPPVIIHKSLPFSERQLLLQMNRMLGMPYSWGDERTDGMDCSSTVRAFYACFGVFLPRNSSEQKTYGEKLAAEGKATFFQMERLNAGEKKKIFSALGVGAILHMPGHVMIYAGEKNGEHRIFHNCDTYTEHGVEHIVRRCTISSFLPKMNGTYLDYLTAAWMPLCRQ
ncbi:MAG: C40 family peptidase [Lachnospiraceae bacterium]|nr:C40 family peptidase [Lachnospiraceae bacterium]